jgi:phosphatidate phosphatase APP1
MPGQTGYIEVRYDTQRIGYFTKTVTITANTAQGNHLLTIKGEVKAPISQETELDPPIRE